MKGLGEEHGEKTSMGCASDLTSVTPVTPVAPVTPVTIATRPKLKMNFKLPKILFIQTLFNSIQGQAKNENPSQF